MWVIATLYSSVNPIVSPAAALFFMAGYWSTKYRAMYVSFSTCQMGGAWLPMCIDRLFAGQLIYQLLMVGVLLLKEVPAAALALIPLPIATLAAWRFTETHYARRFQHLPLEAAVDPTRVTRPALCPHSGALLTSDRSTLHAHRDLRVVAALALLQQRVAALVQARRYRRLSGDSSVRASQTAAGQHSARQQNSQGGASDADDGASQRHRTSFFSSSPSPSSFASSSLAMLGPSASARGITTTTAETPQSSLFEADPAIDRGGNGGAAPQAARAYGRSDASDGTALEMTSFTQQKGSAHSDQQNGGGRRGADAAAVRGIAAAAENGTGPPVLTRPGVRVAAPPGPAAAGNTAGLPAGAASCAQRTGARRNSALLADSGHAAAAHPSLITAGQSASVVEAGRALHSVFLRPCFRWELGRQPAQQSEDAAI